MIADAFWQALSLVVSFDPAVLKIVSLSLQVSGAAALIGAAIALPLAAWVVQTRSIMREPMVVLLNASLGLPPVIVGLVVYLLLSRTGPMGALGWLFTPAGMIFAQVILVTPIIAALARQVLEDAQHEYQDLFSSLALTRWQRLQTLLFETRFSLLVLLLAGFGRAIAEVGAVMMVGGNIAGHTRVMTTAIALETSKGELALALALGLILIVIVLIINVTAHYARQVLRRRYA
jgi:tungstate transport system permease protein